LGKVNVAAKLIIQRWVNGFDMLHCQVVLCERVVIPQILLIAQSFAALDFFLRRVQLFRGGLDILKERGQAYAVKRVRAGSDRFAIALWSGLELPIIAPHAPDRQGFPCRVIIVPVIGF